MPSLNKVILIGYMGADPESKYTADGKAVANISVATSFGSKDNKKTEWHRIIMWEKTAEFIKEYCMKGDLVYVEGRIQYRSYDDKEGVKKYVTEIVASNVQKLGGTQAAKEEPPDQDELPF